MCFVSYSQHLNENKKHFKINKLQIISTKKKKKKNQNYYYFFFLIIGPSLPLYWERNLEYLMYKYGAYANYISNH